MRYSRQGYLKFIMFFQFRFGILKHICVKYYASVCVRGRVCMCVSVYAVHSSNSCRWKLQMKLNSAWPERAGRAAAAKCSWPGQDESGLVMRHEVLRSLHKSTLSTCNSCSTHTQTHLLIHPRVPERGGIGLFGLSQQSQVSKLHVIASTLFALSLSSFLSLYLCPSPSTSVCDAIKVSNLSCACLCV